MTVITPVFMEGRGDGIGPAFFVASRGHHADVGGIAPGSMPPLSKTLEEVRIRGGIYTMRTRFINLGLAERRRM